MPWTLDPRHDTIRLTLVDQVDIVEITDLHRVLTSLADDRRGVEVDMSACTAIDCTTLQLVLAFRLARSAGGAPTSVTLAPGPVSELLGRLRLLPLLGARG
jgi:ABC-type transporter Mla MlaB component